MFFEIAYYKASAIWRLIEWSAMHRTYSKTNIRIINIAFNNSNKQPTCHFLMLNTFLYGLFIYFTDNSNIPYAVSKFYFSLFRLMIIQYASLLYALIFFFLFDINSRLFKDIFIISYHSLSLILTRWNSAIKKPLSYILVNLLFCL